MKFYKQTIIGKEFNEINNSNITNCYKDFIKTLFCGIDAHLEFKKYKVQLGIISETICGVLTSKEEEISFNIIWSKEEMESVIKEAKKNNVDKEFIDVYSQVNMFPVLIQNKNSSFKYINDFILELTKFILTI